MQRLGRIGLAASLLSSAGCGGSTQTEGAGGGAAGAGGGGGGPGGPGAAPGTTLWGTRFGRASGMEYPALAVDAEGASIVMGRFYGKVDFGTGEHVAPANNYQLFVAKRDAQGAAIWARDFGDFYAELPGDLAADAQGNVVLTGGFRGTIDFGGEALATAGADDIFVAKLDGAGEHVWSKQFGTADEQYATRVAMTPDGGVVMTGVFLGTLDLGGEELVGSQDGFSMFVARLDAGGEHVYSRAFSGGYYAAATGLAVDAQGNAVLAGVFSGTADFGGEELQSVGDSDLFVVKLDAKGDHVWSKDFGSTYYESGNDVAIDPSGNVLVTGEVTGPIDFGGGSLSPAGDYDYDAFAVKLDPNGGHVWSRLFGSTGYETSRGVASDAEGNVFVTGSFSSLVDFGVGLHEASGGTDAFVLKLAPDGTALWSRRFGNTAEQSGMRVRTDASGDAVVLGSLFGTIDLGNGPLPSTGFWDLFLAKLAR